MTKTLLKKSFAMIFAFLFAFSQTGFVNAGYLESLENSQDITVTPAGSSCYVRGKSTGVEYDFGQYAGVPSNYICVDDLGDSLPAVTIVSGMYASSGNALYAWFPGHSYVIKLYSGDTLRAQAAYLA